MERLSLASLSVAHGCLSTRGWSTGPPTSSPRDRTPEPYRSLREDGPARVRRVVRSAGRVLVLFSGGEKDDRDERVVDKVRLYMEAGATGVMFGRNMWLRKFDHAVALTRRVHQVMARYPR
jgi:class I fructose-bisphosphate aldolase